MFKITRQKRLLAATFILVCAGLILVPFCAATDQGEYDRFPTESRSAEKMVFDLALLRIAGFCGLVIGTGAFVLSLPFSALGGNTRQAYERLMVEPARFTFKRPLGAI